MAQPPFSIDDIYRSGGTGCLYGCSERRLFLLSRIENYPNSIAYYGKRPFLGIIFIDQAVLGVFMDVLSGGRLCFQG